MHMCIEITSLESIQNAGSERDSLLPQHTVKRGETVVLLLILLAVFASCVIATLILSSRLLQTCFKSTLAGNIQILEATVHGMTILTVVLFLLCPSVNVRKER